METLVQHKTITKWVLDSTHSELNFKVKHLMISNVRGSFRKFNVDIEGNEFSDSNIHVSVDANSIFTNDEGRDGHLKSPDFFDAVKFPELVFESAKLIKKDSGNFSLKGNLIIKEKSAPVSLEVEFGGINKDPWGNEKAAFSFSTKINRKDWGLNWNAALETGGVLVSDEVTIYGELQFIKKSV